MGKVTDERIAAIKVLFETGHTLEEDNFADLVDAIQEAAQEHEHVSGGGAGSGTGNAGPVINLQSGTAAEKPGSPAVGDIYVETDTSKVYACYSAGSWTEVGGGGGGAPTDASYVTLDAEGGLSAETRHRDITGENLHDPKAHAASHQNGEDDEISVAGLSGELADDQPAKAHGLGGSKHNSATLAELNALLSDATVDDEGDARDPNAHAASHQAGGSDPIQDATETDKGFVELATVAEAQAGTDTTRTVTPAGLLVRKTGTAIIGGDLTGDARGADAMDLQSARDAATEVASGEKATAIGLKSTASGLCATAVGHVSTASGDYSVAIGHKATASGNYSTAAGRYSTASDYSSLALGSGNTASGYYAIAVGIANTASGRYSTAVGLYNSTWSDYSMAIGYMTITFAEKSMALGYGAKAGVPTTVNICGPQIIRKDRGENADYTFYSYCGVEVVLTSKEIDLTTVADQTLTLPAGCKFWLDEIGIIATQIDGLTTQPTIRFGITGDLAKHHTAAITTKLTAAGKREKFDPLVPEDGETSLTAGVTSAAAGTTVKGRFYWKGMLIEDE